jgi:hypothetical protein
MSDLQNYKQINGWGVDADPENDPTYPMKHRTNEEHKGYSWDRPTQQEPEVEILHSIERPNITAVFGTSTPPDGLSGMLRRLAFTYSENSYGHWLPLLLADRVNMIEGIIEDLGDGHIPNLFQEKGYTADWKHNRASLIAKFAIGAFVAAAVVGAMNSKPRRR